jgi:hypothetical protein
MSQWSDNDGYVRGAIISIFHPDGTGELAGYAVDEPGPNGYPQVIEAGSVPLEAGDALRLSPVACEVGMTPGTAPTLNNFGATLKWVAQPGS